VETKVLVQAVKRNRERFPSDFMIQLTVEEFASLRSQFVTSNSVSMTARDHDQRFLVDNALSPTGASRLATAGQEADSEPVARPRIVR
jgi:hypothetical protein